MRFDRVRCAEGDECTQFDNGVTIYTRRVRSRGAALSLWLESGVRDEAPAQAGFAHMVEHLLFKGADGLGAEGLARTFEAMGGQINAYTGREHMVLHGFVPGADACRLARLFASMLAEPVFRAHDVAVEREVVLQEMAMIREDPEEAMADQAIAAVWSGHPLSRNILGDAATISEAREEDLRRYMAEVIRGGRVLVVATGDVAHGPLVEALALLGRLPSGGRIRQEPPVFHGGADQVCAPVSQTHLLWLMPSPGVGSSDEAALAVANHILGGGASSRLFLEVREKLGLAYDIQSRVESYEDVGLWSIETACAVGQEQRCRAAVEQVLQGLIAHGVEPDEADVARRHLQASLTLEDEDPRLVCERVARDLIYRGEPCPDVFRRGQIGAVRDAGLGGLLARAWHKSYVLEWLPESPVD